MDIAHVVHPAVAQVTQPSLLVGDPDALMQVKRRRQRQVRGEVGGTGVYPRTHVTRAALFTHVGVDIGHPAATDIQRADADRRADPFVQVDADEIRFETRQLEIQLTNTVCGIDDCIHATTAGHLDDLRHRQHHAVAMADLGQQHQAQVRMSIQRGGVGIDQALMGGRFGQVDRDHLHSATVLQPFHRGDHAVVIQIGVQHRIARTQSVVAADQRLQRLGGAAGEYDLIAMHSKRLCGTRPYCFIFGRIGLPPIPGVIAVHLGDPALVVLQHRPRHRPPIAVLQMHHLIGDVVETGDLGPIRVVLCQCVRGNSRGRQHGCRRYSRDR